MARVLVGFMGAGKSTIAELLNPAYIDMDEVLVEELGMSISDFFAKEGEVAFRERESQVLAKLLKEDKLISTGGGVVTSASNRQLLKEATEVIYLKADFETLYARIAADTKNRRPLFLNNTKETLQDLFNQRQKWYEEVANLVVSVDDKSPRDIVEAIQCQ